MAVPKESLFYSSIHFSTVTSTGRRDVVIFVSTAVKALPL